MKIARFVKVTLNSFNAKRILKLQDKPFKFTNSIPGMGGDCVAAVDAVDDKDHMIDTYWGKLKAGTR